jgi:hypothetical protein
MLSGFMTLRMLMMFMMLLLGNLSLLGRFALALDASLSRLSGSTLALLGN